MSELEGTSLNRANPEEYGQHGGLSGLTFRDLSIFVLTETTSQERRVLCDKNFPRATLHTYELFPEREP